MAAFLQLSVTPHPFSCLSERPLPLQMATSSRHPTVCSSAYSCLYLNRPTYCPQRTAGATHLHFITACPPGGRRTVGRRSLCLGSPGSSLEKRPSSLVGVSIFGMCCLLHNTPSSHYPVTLPLGPLWSSSDLLLYLLSSCNSGGLQPPRQGPM